MTMALQKAEQVEKDLLGSRSRTKMDLQGADVSVVLWLAEDCYLTTQNCCPEKNSVQRREIYVVLREAIKYMET